MADSIEQLSYELTANALSEQERTLAGLRTCASTVLAAASIAGSFLGFKFSHGSLEVFAIAAMISFAFCLGCATWVLLPHRFVFAFPGNALLGLNAFEPLRDVTDAYSAVSTWVEPHLQANKDKLGGLSTWLTISCVLLAAEIVLWTISVGG
jgi:hypothetical protein